MGKAGFDWDAAKDARNQRKHGVSFQSAQHAFLDSSRVIVTDLEHSWNEVRYFCIGKVAGKILTVRFTYRDDVIRIIGAGYWRKGKRVYEQQNQIH
jgi:uncharacterized DUF497 family protein